MDRLEAHPTTPLHADSGATPAPSRQRLSALTGLRFFLAAHVLLFHFAPTFFGDSGFGNNLIRAGSSAVSGFFLLSGFILTYAHVESSDSSAGPALNIGAARFWAARFLRIYPAYLVAFILAAPFVIAGFRSSSQHYGAFCLKTVPYLLMLQAWIPNLSHYWNYPAWSLSAEAFFYVLFPALASSIFARKSADWLLLGASWIAGLIAPLLLLNRVEYQWLLESPPCTCRSSYLGWL